MSWSWCWISWKITLPSQWFTFLLERRKIGKIEKIVANLDNKTMNVIYRNLKQALRKLVLEKVHRVLFNQ